MIRYYAGIGSQETPGEVCDRMTRYASWLREGGYILRSGHALGADQAFEAGAGHDAEIYLPWLGFQGEVPINGYGFDAGQDEDLDVYVNKFHPRPSKLSRGARALMRRNTCQILGRDPPASSISDFVLCWTRDGTAVGGTGQAIRIATAYDVPTFNLYYRDADEQLLDFLRSRP